MNQNIGNPNFEKEIGFHASFPSEEFHCPQVLILCFLPIQMLLPAHQGRSGRN